MLVGNQVKWHWMNYCESELAKKKKQKIENNLSIVGCCRVAVAGERIFFFSYFRFMQLGAVNSSIFPSCLMLCVRVSIFHTRAFQMWAVFWECKTCIARGYIYAILIFFLMRRERWIKKLIEQHCRPVINAPRQRSTSGVLEQFQRYCFTHDCDQLPRNKHWVAYTGDNYGLVL